MIKFLIPCLLMCKAVLHADALEVSDPDLWTVLYRGEYSLGHKMILCRPALSTNDELFNQFMMAYLSYKANDLENAEVMFIGIDQYVEHFYIK